MDNARGQELIQRQTLSMQQASEYAGVSYWTMRKMTQAREIPSIKMGNRYYFREETLSDWLQDKEIASLSKGDKTIGNGGVRKVEA